MAIRLLVAIICILWSISCSAAGQNRKLVLLFTSDLHSQVLPNSNNEEGFAKIASVVSRERELAKEQGAAFLLVDGGDISMGSVFHTLFAEEAIEYRAMARIGYDAYALGNHAFDFGTEALVQMFANARSKDSLYTFPQLLAANIHYEGVPSEKYAVLERNGLKIGVFGLMGENSHNVMGSKSRDKVEFNDPVQTAKEIVETLKPQTDYIIALSHGGASCGDDVKLAKKVRGIDFIVSGHDHDVFPEPVQVKGTPLGAAGANGKYVGKAVFQDGALVGYELIPVDASVPANPAMESWIDSMYNVVGVEFEKLSGKRLDDTIAFVDREYPDVLDENKNMVLGTNIAAAYRQTAIGNLPEVSPSQIIGVVPMGVIRKGLKDGVLTNRDAFEVLSLGENERGRTGYPLVYVWVTGKELQDLCEMSVTVSPFWDDAKLFFSGLDYRYNGAGFPFLRVDKVEVDGQVADPEKLYMLVTCQYTAQLVGMLKTESYGILSAVPKDANGQVLAEGYLYLRNKDGRTIPVWEAFAGYLEKGLFDSKGESGTVENDDFVPLGYTLGAVLLCALILWLMRNRKTCAKH